MKINEDNLIGALRQKDPAAIEYVVDRYGALLKAVLLRNLCEYDERWEECFHDVLMALWTHPERFEEKKSQLKNWLCAIAKYKAIDLVRRERRAARGRIALDESQWAAIADESIDVGGPGGDGTLAELQKLLRCLSPEDQELFVRRYGLEQPVAQISAETGMHRDLIYTRISRGKKKLRNLYKNHGGE